MEEQLQTNKDMSQEAKPKKDNKFAIILIINIIVTIAVSVLVVYTMETDLRADVKEIQEKVKHIKIAK